MMKNKYIKYNNHETKNLHRRHIKSFDNEKEIKLCDNFSNVYYTNDEFRNNLNTYSRATNKNIFVTLNCGTSCCEINNEIIDNEIIDIEIIDIDKLNSVHELNLSSYMITNKNNFGSIHKLVVYNCAIGNTNNFSNIHTLSILNCVCSKYIGNVTKIKKLIINEIFKENKSTNISDVTYFYQLDELDMCRCTGIKDIGNLRNIKILSISTKVYGLHLLKNLKTLCIEHDAFIQMIKEIKKLRKINNEICIYVHAVNGDPLLCLKKNKYLYNHLKEKNEKLML
jgi:hypothetical protein